MKFKKFLSVLLALSIVASCMAVAGTVFASGAETEVAESAYEEMLAETSADAGYGLSSTVNDGTILQAWTWSFANIDAKLEQIAEQGFTTVQVSPPNEIKKGTSGAKFLQSDNQNGWWMFYQPAGFQLNQSTDNALGTKAQFVAMCEHAHQLGVKIIVDAVINHMGTKEGDDSNTSTDPMSHVTPNAAQFEPEIYNNKLFHTPWAKMTYKEDPNQYSQYDSTYDLTRNCTSGLPDLKTEDSRVQTAIYDYMDELISSGADGFRFDAAKHIETPDDISSLKSDFWTNTLRAVQNKYSDKEIYAYGEILNNCGVNRPFSMYTKLMDVTDSSSYWGIKDAVTSGGGNATPYYPNTNFTSANTVLWDESHDTYVDGSTTNLNTTQRGKIWALVAGRSGISCVYLARPSDDTNTNALYNITLGTANNTSWSNATTKAVNQFHNFYIGQSEYCTANSGGTAYIERGTTGAVIVNLGGTTTKSVSLANHKLTNGTYVDTITGNTFTVSGGKIAGQVGSTGVATIYKDDVLNPPTEAPTEPPITYILGDVDDDGEVSSIDATFILRYSIDLAEFDDKAMLAGDVDGDGYVSVIDATFIQRYLAEMPVKYDIGQEKSGTYNPNPTEPPVIPTTTQPTTVTPATVTPTTTQPTYNDGDEVTLYFSNNKGWDGVNVYMWSDLGGEAAEWPGVAATFVKNNDYGEGIYSVTVNTAQYDKVVFNGSAGQTADVDVYEAAAAGCGLYCLDTTDSEGHYNVGFYAYDPDPVIINPTTHVVDPTTTQPTYNDGDEVTLYFSNNKGWDGVNVYMWSDLGGEAAEWPGVAATFVKNNDYGEGIYSVTVNTAQYDKVVFNGSAGQTADVDVYEAAAAGCGLYCLDTTDSEGHYNVGFYAYDPDPVIINPTTSVVDPTTTQPTQGGGDGQTYTLYFSNNKYWSNVKVHMWTDGGATTTWPGNDADYVGINDIGETVYSATVDTSVYDHIIFNGSGGQTIDISVADAVAGGCGLYCLDTTNGEGHFNVAFYEYTGLGEGGNTDPTQGGNTDPTQGGNTDPTQGGNTDPTQGGGDGQTYTLYFSNNKYWSNVKVHMWTDGGATTTWPGNDADYVGINDIGETVYSATVDTSVYDHIIFNGSGGQTIDISVADAVAGGCGLYCLDTTNGQGHFNVAFYEYTGLGEGGNTDPTQGGGDDPQPGNMLYLNPGSNWSQANARFAAYFFGNGDKWVDMSSNGDGTYSVEVPDGYTSVIFVRMNPDNTANNWDNKWNQTSDLTISGNIGKTYYVTGWDYSGNWG